MIKSSAKFVPAEIDCYLKPSLDDMRRVSFFAALSDEDMSSFCEAAQMRAYKKGKILGSIRISPRNLAYLLHPSTLSRLKISDQDFCGLGKGEEDVPALFASG